MFDCSLSLCYELYQTGFGRRYRDNALVDCPVSPLQADQLWVRRHRFPSEETATLLTSCSCPSSSISTSPDMWFPIAASNCPSDIRQTLQFLAHSAYAMHCFHRTVHCCRDSSAHTCGSITTATQKTRSWLLPVDNACAKCHRHRHRQTYTQTRALNIKRQ